MHKMWNRSHEISPNLCPELKAVKFMQSPGGGIRTPGFPASSTHSVWLGYPRLSPDHTCLTGEDSTLNRFDFTFLQHSKADKKVFWIINLGTLSSYWPWNTSSFFEKLFLKKECQKPFWVGSGKCSLLFLGQSRHLYSPFPQVPWTGIVACWQ